MNDVPNFCHFLKNKKKIMIYSEILFWDCTKQIYKIVLHESLMSQVIENAEKYNFHNSSVNLSATITFEVLFRV